MVPVLIIHAMKEPQNITIPTSPDVLWRSWSNKIHTYFKEEKEKNDSKSKSWLKKDNI
jgi:hypothetical protein